MPLPYDLLEVMGHLYLCKREEESPTVTSCRFGHLVGMGNKRISQQYGEQEAHHTVGLGDTPRRLVRKRCQYSSLEKFEDVFDTEVDFA